MSLSTPRKDKKKEIKASLPRDTRDLLEVRAAALNLSPMSYAEKLALSGLHNEKVIRAFSPYFKRGYVPLFSPDSVLIGHVIAPNLSDLLSDGNDITRFPVKFQTDDHLLIGELAFSFASSLSQTLAVLLSESLLQNITINEIPGKEVAI